MPAAQATLVEAGSLIALLDPFCDLDTDRVSLAADKIAVRVARRGTVCAYLLEADEDGQKSWVLDSDSVAPVHLVDEDSDEMEIDLNRKTLTLAFHPDMSLKTYGVKKGTDAAAVAGGIGGVLDSVIAKQEKAATPAKQEEQSGAKLVLVRGAQDPFELVACLAQARVTPGSAVAV